MQRALATFADACVVKPLRERFMHEAQNRPRKLHERVCHHTAELLEPKFAGGKASFNPDEPCLMLQDAKGFKEESWAEAENLMDGYGGVLVISLTRGSFYCESEASPKREVWAGSF